MSERRSACHELIRLPGPGRTLRNPAGHKVPTPTRGQDFARTSGLETFRGRSAGDGLQFRGQEAVGEGGVPTRPRAPQGPPGTSPNLALMVTAIDRTEAHLISQLK